MLFEVGRLVVSVVVVLNFLLNFEVTVAGSTGQYFYSVWLSLPSFGLSFHLF